MYTDDAEDKMKCVKATVLVRGTHLHGNTELSGEAAHLERYLRLHHEALSLLQKSRESGVEKFHTTQLVVARVLHETTGEGGQKRKIALPGIGSRFV